MEKTLGIKLIGIFYFLIALFYGFFGILISGVLFLFFSAMSVSNLLLSAESFELIINFAKLVLPDFMPLLYLILGSSDKGVIISFGIASMILSCIFLISVLLLKRGKFLARYFIAGYSCFEVILAISLFNLESIIAHLVVHISIILYLLFSKSSKVYFRNSSLI